MSAKQRLKNRATASALHKAVINNTVCPKCGEKGAHWLCDKFYGQDGRRIELVEDPK